MRIPALKIFGYSLKVSKIDHRVAKTNGESLFMKTDFFAKANENMTAAEILFERDIFNPALFLLPPMNTDFRFSP